MDVEENTSRTSPNASASPVRGVDLLGQDDCSNSNHTSTSDSKQEEKSTSAAGTSIDTSSAALSSSVSTKNEDSSVSITVVDEVVAATRIEAQAGLEGQQGNNTKQQEQDAEQEHQAQPQQAQHHKYDSDIRHDSNNSTNHTITSFYSVTDTLTTTRSNMYDASSYSRPRTPFAISAEEDSKGRVPMMKEGTRRLNSSSPLSHPPPRPADDSIVPASAGITTSSTSPGVTFPAGYPAPSSLVTRSSNTNSSSSQQKTKPSSPKGQEQAGQDYFATKKRRRITLSTIQALRSCTTYVTRVKTSLLASNHDAEFDAFLELLCNWSDQGLTSEEVFSQMEVILQDVSPELLAAFTTFLPGDTQEKARLHHIASASRMLPTIRGAHEDEIQVVSTISDKHRDSDNEDKVQEQEGYPPPA
jgi:hypothetical protein